MSNDLVRVKNRNTDEELLLSRSHLARWPDDPYDVIDDAPAPVPVDTSAGNPSAYAEHPALGYQP